MFAYNETVENLIKREIDNGNIVGASMLVIHKNREIYHNTWEKLQEPPVGLDIPQYFWICR